MVPKGIIYRGCASLPLSAKMDFENELLSKTNEVLFFCDLPGTFFEHLVGLEAKCCKEEAADLVHPSCCRELIFTLPEILVSPCHDASNRLYIITKRESSRDEKFLQLLQKLHIQIEREFEVHKEIFQYCLNFSLIHRVAPLWNRMGPFLVHVIKFENYLCFGDQILIEVINQMNVEISGRYARECIVVGKKFFQENDRLDSVRMSITVTNEICLSLRACQVKLPACQIKDFCSRFSVLEKFYAESSSEIGANTLDNNSCITLPSARRGWVASIARGIPKTSPFKDYSRLRQHWKLMYGIHLPVEECSEFYNVSSLGRKVYTYPSYCIRSCEPVIFTRCNQEDVIQSFLRDCHQRMSSLCGMQTRFTSSIVFPVATLCVARKSKYFLSTKAKLKQFNRLEIHRRNSTCDKTANIGPAHPQEHYQKASKDIVESKEDKIVPIFGSVSQVSCPKRCKNSESVVRKSSKHLKGARASHNKDGKVVPDKIGSEKFVAIRNGDEFKETPINFASKPICPPIYKKRKNECQESCPEKKQQIKPDHTCRDNAPNKIAHPVGVFGSMKQRKREINEVSAQYGALPCDEARSLSEASSVSRPDRQLPARASDNAQSKSEVCAKIERRSLALELAHEILFIEKIPSDVDKEQCHDAKGSLIDEEAAQMPRRNNIDEEDSSGTELKTSTSTPDSASRGCEKMRATIDLVELQKISTKALRSWLKERKLKVKSGSKKEDLIKIVQEDMKANRKHLQMFQEQMKVRQVEE